MPDLECSKHLDGCPTCDLVGLLPIGDIICTACQTGQEYLDWCKRNNIDTDGNPIVQPNPAP